MMPFRRLQQELWPIITKIWPFGVVAGVGVITSWVGLKLSLQAAGALSTGVLAATLVAATWYTLETRSLRLQQQWDSDIRNHPWLKGSDLKVNRDEGPLIWREVVYLPIKNVGLTPAHDVHITVRWRVEGQEPSAGHGSHSGISLAPGDTGRVKLCQIDFEAPGDQASIDVEIAYKSSVGGGGQLKMNFYTHERGWTNGPMSYEFWLSDGRRFPAQAGRPHN